MDNSLIRRKWILWPLAVYVVGAAVLLLSPVGPGDIIAAIVSWLNDSLGMTSVRQGWVDFGGNILLFIPLGFFMTLLLRRTWAGMLLGLALSVCVELVQVVLPDRSPSLRDIGANALGAVIGAALAWILLMMRHRSGRPTATTRAPGRARER